MKKITAGILGFAAAPLVSALIFSATTPLFDTWNVVARIKFVPITYLIAAVITFLFALPAFVLLSWLRLVRWWSATAVGLAIGALMANVLGGVTVAGTLFMAATGVASALVFWAIWTLGANGQAEHQRGE